MLYCYEFTGCSYASRLLSWLKYGGVGDDIEYTALMLENLNRMLYIGDDIEYSGQAV